MSRKAMDGVYPSCPGNALLEAVICSTKLLIHLGIVPISLSGQKICILKGSVTMQIN